MEDENPGQAPQPEMSSAERRRLKRLKAKEERKEERQSSAHKSSGMKMLIILGAVLLIGGIGYAIYSGSNAQASAMESFSQCLKDKGAVIYGNNWCQYTQKQMHMFGSPFSKLKYVVCDENKALCDEKKITITPTWEIDGKMYQQVQTLETLSQLSGCKFG